MNFRRFKRKLIVTLKRKINKLLLDFKLGPSYRKRIIEIDKQHIVIICYLFEQRIQEYVKLGYEELIEDFIPTYILSINDTLDDIRKRSDCKISMSSSGEILINTIYLAYKLNIDKGAARLLAIELYYGSKQSKA
jgi:hypothetical protein